MLLLLICQAVHAEYDREIIPQENETTSAIGYVLAATPAGIEIHAVSKSGALNLVATLPSTIAIDRYGEADWLIHSAFDFKVSPNGSDIAFTATNTTNNKIKLFIYQVTQNNLIENGLLKDVSLLWSPDSNSLLLSNSDQTQIYDLHTDRFIQVANFGFGESIWLPDNQHIVYVGEGIPCDTPCKPFNDLYVINRDGTDNHSITNLGTQIPVEVFHSICEPTWSSGDKRVYFRVGCVFEDIPEEYLFSTTLSGENRPENAPDITSVISRRITNLNVDKVNHVIYEFITEKLLGETSWKIIAFGQNNHPKVIFKASRRSGDIPQYIALSPDGQYVSLNASLGPGSRTGFLWVINVKSGYIAASKEDLENICQLLWSDNKTIIFTQQDGGNPSCHDEYFSIDSRSLSKFDLDTGKVTPLTSEFTVPTFFITVPES